MDGESVEKGCMKASYLDHQDHAYRAGHELVASTIKLAREDQDVVDRLSDISGGLRPGETFAPYLTTYPLPSRAYYVVAKTWQDLKAPRAGCVHTRSVIIPMDIWSTIDSFDSIDSLFIIPEFTSDPETMISLPLPIVHDPRRIDIVESLFLETRQPLVIFESEEADVILRRLLLAMWPGIRSRFSACTFSLSPRRLEGREFDLLFAPNNARSRFADWSGRRISTTSKMAARHRWSADLANGVFTFEKPSLVTRDPFQIFTSISNYNESVLRLSLLWNELSAKSQTSQSAVLGMVDILNAQPKLSASVINEASSAIISSINKISSNHVPQDSWSFLSTLTEKMSHHIFPESVYAKVSYSVATLTSNDTTSAINFLTSEDADNKSIPHVLYGAIATGFAISNDDNISVRLSSLPSLTLLDLMSSSQDFVRFIFSLASHEPERWVVKIKEVLRHGNCLKSVPIRFIGTIFNHKSLAPLLSIFLADTNADEFLVFVDVIGEQSNFEIVEFDEALISAANRLDVIIPLRDLAIRFSGESDRLLLASMSVNAEDLSWLLKSNIGTCRTSTLLILLLENASSHEINKLSNDGALYHSILNIIISASSNHQSLTSRLFEARYIAADDSLNFGLLALPKLATIYQAKVAISILKHSLIFTSISDTRTFQVVGFLDSTLKTPDLIDIFFDSRSTNDRIDANLKLLSSAPKAIWDAVIDSVDLITRALISQHRVSISKKSYKIWSLIIRDGFIRDERKGLDASMDALAFCLQSLNDPVSELIKQSFPVVYRQLLRSKGDDDFKFLPSLKFLPKYFFSDWDRAKSARKHLVVAYIKSTWPAIDLLEISVTVNIEKQVMRYLDKSKEEEDYLRRLNFLQLTDNEKNILYTFVKNAS